MWALLILACYSVYSIVVGAPSEQTTERQFSEFLAKLDEGKVDSVTIKARDVAGTANFHGTFQGGQRYIFHRIFVFISQ